MTLSRTAVHADLFPNLANCQFIYIPKNAGNSICNLLVFSNKTGRNVAEFSPSRTYTGTVMDGEGSEIELLPTAESRCIRKSWEKRNRLRDTRHKTCFYFTLRCRGYP